MSKSCYNNSVGCSVGIFAMGFYATLIGVCWFITAKLFEYILWSAFEKDVPWYLDLLGGLVCNGLLLPVAILCAILRAAGVEIPFFQ